MDFKDQIAKWQQKIISHILMKTNKIKIEIQSLDDLYSFSEKRRNNGI